MSERLIPVLLSGSPHKKSEWLRIFDGTNIHPRSISLPPFSPEPSETPCAIKVGPKLSMFLKNPGAEREMALQGLSHGILATIMDVNGLIVNPELFGKEETLSHVALTTCRGVEDKLVKAKRTIGQVKNISLNEVVFQNIVSCGEYGGGVLSDVAVYTDAGRLTMSAALLDYLGDENHLKKVMEYFPQNEAMLVRPLCNENASGAFDWSVSGLYAWYIGMMTGIEASVTWENSAGQKWVADSSGVPDGMLRDMSYLLRGFSDRTAIRIMERAMN